MKQMLFYALLAVIATSRAYGQARPVYDTANFYGAAFQKAAFPGGQDSLSSFVKRHMRYPQAAREAGVEGRVLVRFMVTEQGAITALKVVRGIGAGCDEEAKRIVAAMPQWNPPVYKGHATRSTVLITILFELE